MLHNSRLVILKERVKKNPKIGQKNIDGSYEYKQNNYTIRYRILTNPFGRESVEWISEKRKAGNYEKIVKKALKIFFKIWHYQGLLIFFRPPVILPLIIGIIIFYFGFIETKKTRIDRSRWIVSRIVGINPSQIQYIGNGWLEIYAKRKTTTDKIFEHKKYTINPFEWFFSSSWKGFVSYWRDSQEHFLTQPVVYNNNGDVWMKKEGSWKHGRFINTEKIKWDAKIDSRMVPRDE